MTAEDGPQVVRKIPQPTVVTRRDERTLLTVADYVKYMVDVSTGLVTLIFYQVHPTPELDAKGKAWAVNEVVHESLLEVKVPIATIGPTAMGLIQLFTDQKRMQEIAQTGMIVFGPTGMTPKTPEQQATSP
jgi:hypothetical protein